MKEVYYVSQEGLKKLKEEKKHRSTILRRAISEKIGTAKDQGDLSENFEYQEAKEEQAQNETRIIQLNDMIARTIVIEKKEGSDTIQIGVKFSAILPNGSEKEFEIVGGTESDPISGKISNESPLGNAFLGKKNGDIVEIEIQSGKVKYKVVSIK